MVFVLYGVIGVQLWSGELDDQCRTKVYPVGGAWPLADPAQMCGYAACEGDSSESRVCGNEREAIAAGNMTTMSPWPEDFNFGITTFDNMGRATLTIFQCITMEGWTPVMYNVQDAYSPWASVYFLTLTIFGSFFLLNMVLAVIWDKFSQFHKKQDGHGQSKKSAHDEDDGSSSDEEPAVHRRQKNKYMKDAGADKNADEAARKELKAKEEAKRQAMELHAALKAQDVVGGKKKLTLRGDPDVGEADVDNSAAA